MYLSFTLRFNIRPLLPDFFPYHSTNHRKKNQPESVLPGATFVFDLKEKSQEERRKGWFFQQMLARYMLFYCHAGSRGVVNIFPSHTGCPWLFLGSFNCSSTTLGGILTMDFHGILRKDSCNTNSKQTWEGFVRGDWPQNDGVVLVMKRHYPSQRVFLNPTLGRAMMIWFRGYPIGTNQPLWCKGTQQIKSGQILASVRSNHDPTFATSCIWWCLIETLTPKRGWKLGKNIQVDEFAQLLRVDWTQDWVCV